MIGINKVHHVSIICSDYHISKSFYTDILGFKIKNEIYRPDRKSYKLDLGLHDNYVIELFSFPDPPKRTTWPEASGLRHIAFEVDNIEESMRYLKQKKIDTEPVRVDEVTKKRFTFFNDPDNLPIELYEK